MTGAVPPASALAAASIHHHEVVPSTMDEAHRLATDGAPAGTLVVADRQSHGRGRGGKSWDSTAGHGLWMTLLERPDDPAAIAVLSLRVGLAIARTIEPFAEAAVTLKWPNDVFSGDGKVAGTLIEARWRDGLPEWVAIGVGINLRRPPSVPDAAAVAAGTTRDELLRAIVPALRAAAAQVGPLSPAEVAAWGARDRAVGRAIVAPTAGVVIGITPDGALLVREQQASADAAPVPFRSGSLVFAPHPAMDPGGLEVTC
jgi:BirA family biotin operon repressor/biotin-[acetyl-CoA-carboxylase] ligase